MANNQPSTILTCTVDVNGVEQMARMNLKSRLEDYKTSLTSWLKNPDVKNIVFIENSGYDLSEFKKISSDIKHNKNIEFISIEKNSYPRHLGKGYGEYLTLKELLEKSEQLNDTKRFIKITGRYYIKNIKKIADSFSENLEIYCNLTKGLTYSDSRVFGGSINFLKNYLCVYGASIDDSKGRYIEHVLAESFLRGISNGLEWGFLSETPIIEGYSGTLNVKYNDRIFQRLQKNFGEKLKEYLIRK